MSDSDDRIGQILAALGTIRQDVRSILGHLGIQGFRDEPGVCEGGCNCHAKDWTDSEYTGKPEPSESELKKFVDDWRKRADEAWEREVAKRPTGDELTPEEIRDWHEGWAR